MTLHGGDPGSPSRGHRHIAAWAVIALSVLILLVFAVIRISDMTALTPSVGAFEERYTRHPGMALLHILPGLVFVTLAPLQLVERLRSRYPHVHRWMGRVVVACGAISGVMALIVAIRLPAFGGVTTIAATMFFGVIFLVSLGKAVWHIRRWEVLPHREWMLRALSLGLGVATIRVYIGTMEVFDLGFEAVFGAAFWLGFSTNLIAAEIWINRTRSRPSDA